MINPRHLRRFPADERHPHVFASFRQPFADGFQVLGHDFADGNIIQEKDRLGAGSDDIVNAVGDNIFTDRIEFL